MRNNSQQETLMRKYSNRTANKEKKSKNKKYDRHIKQTID